MTKIKTIQEAVENIKYEIKIMTAGFLGVGAPLKMIDKVVKTTDADLIIADAVKEMEI